MSEVKELALIHKFVFDLVSMFRKTDNQQMARLNYMASRIRAAMCQLATSSNTEKTAQWWWTGLTTELVTYKTLKAGDKIRLIESRKLQWRLSVTQPPQ